MSATDDRAAMSTLSNSAAGRPRRDAAGAGGADERFHPLDFADARQEAWLEERWIGLLRVWLRAAADVARSLTLQWMRTHIPLIAVVSMAIALSAAAVAQTLVPKEPFFANLQPHDRDLAALLLLTACVVLVIASTIIFTLWFLRPLLYRGSQRRR